MHLGNIKGVNSLGGEITTDCSSRTPYIMHLFSRGKNGTNVNLLKDDTEPGTGSIINDN
jgi:hypothetical protein